MKIMLTSSYPAEIHDAVIERWKKTSENEPVGFKSLGRWHAIGSHTVFHLIETDDLVAAGKALNDWLGLADFKLTPVVDDAEVKEIIGF